MPTNTPATRKKELDPALDPVTQDSHPVVARFWQRRRQQRPKILRGEEAKAKGISAPPSVLARTGGGLKGFSGPAGSGIGRSVSHPAKLQDLGKLPDADAPMLPQVGFSGDVGDYAVMRFDSGTKRSRRSPLGLLQYKFADHASFDDPASPALAHSAW